MLYILSKAVFPFESKKENKTYILSIWGRIVIANGNGEAL